MANRSFGEEVAESGSCLPETVSLCPDADFSKIPPQHSDVPSAQAPAVDGPEPRLALLIGNERYQGNRLATPVADVRMLADVLGSLGFAVDKIENGDRSAMHEALAAFASRLDQAGPDAAAFVYFAGHGFQDDGINYLVPVGTELPSRVYLKARTLAVDDIVQALTAVHRKANVIVLDACRKTPLALQPRTRDVTEGLADLKLPAKATMLVAYSTSAGSVAADDIQLTGDRSSRHSPYAAALEQALPGLLEPNRRIYDVFFDAAERVKAATGGAQSPALYVQGVAPPLNTTQADRERFKTWVFYQAYWTWQRVAKYAAAAIVATTLAAAAAWWQTRYPETRALLLHRAGLRTSAALALDCRHPSEATISYGMNERDWCSSAFHHWPRLARFGADREAELVSGIAAGDPRALALAAALLFDGKLGRLDGRVESAPHLAARSARGGFLPAWPMVADNRAATRSAIPTLTDDEILAGIKAADGAGVHPATWHLAVLAWARGQFDDAIARLEAAEKSDDTGVTAGQLGRLLVAGSEDGRRPWDLSAGVRWLLQAGRKGDDIAVLQLLTLSQKKAIRLTEDEMSRVFEQFIRKRPARGLLLRSLFRLQTDDQRWSEAVVADLERAAADGEHDAIPLLITLYSKGVQGKVYPEKALRWLKSSASRGGESEQLEYALALAEGLPDPLGHPQISPDPDAARPYLERWLAAGSSRAKVALADLIATGAFGERDLTKARSILADVSIGRTSDSAARQDATIRLQRLDMAPRLEAAGAIEGLSVGRPDAPVSIVVYLRFGCPTCAVFLTDVIDPIKRRYVEPGLVRIAFRQLFFKADLAQSVDAGMALQCLPPGDRLAFVQTLIQSFESWTSLPSRDERLTFFQARGLQHPPGEHSAPISEDCFLRNRAAQDALRLQLDAADSIFGGGNTPSPVVFVAGERLDEPGLRQIDTAVVKALRPQDRPMSSGPPR